LISKTSYRAFTLWDLMIAMLITSLIVSLSYGVYWKFTRVLNEDIDLSDQMQKMRLLERELFQLTQSCLTITQEGDQLFFNNFEEYSYLQFSDSTMMLENLDYLSDFTDESYREFPIEEWSAEYLNDESDHIKSFQIRYKVDLQIYTLTFKKSYTRLFLYSMQEL